MQSICLSLDSCTVCFLDPIQTHLVKVLAFGAKSVLVIALIVVNLMNYIISYTVKGNENTSKIEGMWGELKSEIRRVYNSAYPNTANTLHAEVMKVSLMDMFTQINLFFLGGISAFKTHYQLGCRR